ncbi:hypothetical protein AALP_AA7G063700 [Arabis alpina]|uniref:Neprosin PEP catalytic domain-containing protein n=1 Tax=Arabis alpina TaxID=50452 RepID=A0A087GGA5_ARAAL|nr:hypothetical protein AALP_AA7G063700 [Arabis alpina]
MPVREFPGLKRLDLSELKNLTNLEVLALARNDFNGPIPIEVLCEMKHLRELDLRGNHFVGKIGVGLRTVTYLVTLDVSNNRLTGALPSWISDLMLSSLLISNNFLEETTTKLFLQSNNFAGSIPDTLLGRVEMLDLRNNKLSGSIIPQGGQFNTFNENSYVGNPLLCGPPTDISCEAKKNSEEADNGGEEEDDQTIIDMLVFYWASASTWVAVVIGILVLNSSQIPCDLTKHGDVFDCIDMNKQLAFDHPLLNSLSIQSFKTEHGQIFDCIDIHKQLAFDHHLLRNHSIQLKPTTVPEWITGNNISQKVGPSQLLHEDINCPLGTFATVDYTHSLVSGVKGNINLWDPKVSLDQVSFATMAIAGGPLVSISVGWMVYPLLYEQGHIHLYTYWTADGYITGCYDTRCPGFVQVSKRIPLGVLLQPISVYKGTQREMDLSLHQDRATGNWWFIFGGEANNCACMDHKKQHFTESWTLSVYKGTQREMDLSLHQDHGTGDWWFIFGGENVGYWPKSLFIGSGLVNGAHLSSWGGQVYSPLAEKSPLMGSGHFPKEGFGKAAFINGINIIDGSGKVLIPQIYTIKTHESSPNCYKAKYIHDDADPWYRAVYYGGPGGCTGTLSMI